MYVNVQSAKNIPSRKEEKEYSGRKTKKLSKNIHESPMRIRRK